MADKAVGGSDTNEFIRAVFSMPVPTDLSKNDRFLFFAKWAAVLVAIVYILPYFLLGSNAYIRIHDTLEGEWIWFKLLRESRTGFTLDQHAVVPQVMKGLLRSAFPTGLSVNMLLVTVFGTYLGYIISSVSLRLIGFAGMLLLLRRYFLIEPESRYIAWLVAITFSVLSVYTPFGISVTGQPLLLWAFLNLYHRKQLGWSYLYLLIFPFYASIVWLLIPLFTVLGIVLIYLFFKKQLNVHLVLGTVFLFCLFILVNFPMFTLTFFNKDFISHRSEYNLYMVDRPELMASIGETITTFLTTLYHVSNFVTVVCFLAVILVWNKLSKPLRLVFFGIVGICLFQGFYSFLEYSLVNHLVLLKSFRLNRFCIFLPFMWLLLFAASLAIANRSKVLKPLILPFVLMQFFVTIMDNDEWLHNMRMLTGHQKFPNYENYLAPNQFDSIKKYIGKPVNSYYVASLGMSPTVAQFNGLYTLDGLQSIYDLNYKKQFRQIFIKEIEKSDAVKQYFDGWGNRCYIFSSELGMRYTAYNSYKQTPKAIEHFEFDAEAFKQLGGTYLLSAVEIKNHDLVGLQLEKVFADEQSWWNIYLYRVKS